MAKKETEELSLKAKPPRVTRLNRRTIIFLSGLLLLVVILIMVSALSESSGDSNSSSVPDSHIQSHASAIKSNKQGVDSLPSGYQDSAEIDKLLNRNQKPKVIDKIPSSVENELNALRQQQQSLESQLASLRSKPVAPPKQPLYTAQDQQAMTSAIFIAGGAPKTEPTQTQQEADKAKKDAGNDADKNGKQSDYAEQNDQSGKLDFLSSKPDKSIYNKNTIQHPASKYILQAGGIIPAILQSTIVSNLPGMITAIVSQNVYDSITGQYLLIPKGSRLIGQYNSKISYGQDQLQAVFTRIIRPDGTSIVLPGKSAGVNPMGTAGFEDEVNNHWGRIIGSAALITLFNIPAVIATNQQQNSYTTVNGYPVQNNSLSGSTSSSALQALGQSVSTIGNTIAQRSLNIQPTITINSGYQFSIMIAKDVILPPYQTQFQQIPEIAAS